MPASCSFRSAIRGRRSVGKATESGNRTGTGTFHPPAKKKGSEAMYLGIGGLVILIIILIILFR
jgi:hypothetical protein